MVGKGAYEAVCDHENPRTKQERVDVNKTLSRMGCRSDRQAKMTTRLLPAAEKSKENAGRR